MCWSRPLPTCLTPAHLCPCEGSERKYSKLKYDHFNWEKENKAGWKWLSWVWRFPKDFTTSVSARSSVLRLVENTRAICPFFASYTFQWSHTCLDLTKLSIFYSCPKEYLSLSLFWWRRTLGGTPCTQFPSPILQFRESQPHSRTQGSPFPLPYSNARTWKCALFVWERE